MNFQIDKETYDEIAKFIKSDSSPVGIDATKTHVLILKKLNDLSERLDGIEQKIAEINITPIINP